MLAQKCRKPAAEARLFWRVVTAGEAEGTRPTPETDWQGAADSSGIRHNTTTFLAQFGRLWKLSQRTGPGSRSPKAGPPPPSLGKRTA